MKFTGDDAVARRIQALGARLAHLKANDLYFYNQVIEELRGGARVMAGGGDSWSCGCRRP